VAGSAGHFVPAARSHGQAGDCPSSTSEAGACEAGRWPALAKRPDRTGLQAFQTRMRVRILTRLRSTFGQPESWLAVA